MTKLSEAEVVSALDLKPLKTTKPYSFKEQKKRRDRKQTRIKKNKRNKNKRTRKTMHIVF